MINPDSKILKFTAFVLILLLLVMTGGCSSDDDDESSISVCNFDNEDYRVELRRASDHSIVRAFDIDSVFDVFDTCDTFEDVEEGHYYIYIKEHGDEESDRSVSFYLEEGEYRSFTIDSTGTLGDDSIGDEGVVSVCNQDNHDYIVELRRDSDDSVVDSFELDEPKFYEVSGDCDEFDDIDQGNYYIAVYEPGSDEESRSEPFYLNGGEYEYFIIDDDGDVEKE